MKIFLKPISSDYVDLVTTRDETFPGKKRMIKAMKELYPIIKDHLSQKQLDKLMKMEFIDMFHAFILAMQACIKGEKTGGSAVYDKTKKRYYIRYWAADLLNDYTIFLQPLSFLMPLRNNNRKMYNMVVAAIELMDQKGVCVMNSYMDEMVEGDAEYEAQKLDETDISYEHIDYEFIAEYASYNKFFPILEKDRKKAMNYETLIKALNRYKTDSFWPGEQHLLTWIRRLISVYNTPITMEDCDITALYNFAQENGIEKNEDGYYEFMDGDPVLPSVIVRFNWFKSETVRDLCGSWVGDTAGNFGIAEFYKEYKCIKASDLTKAVESYREETGHFLSQLTDAVADFMENETLIYEYAKKFYTRSGIKNIP